MARRLRKRSDETPADALARRLRKRCGVTPVEALCGNPYGSTLARRLRRRLRKRSGRGSALRRKHSGAMPALWRDACGYGVSVSALARQLRRRYGATPADAL